MIHRESLTHSHLKGVAKKLHVTDWQLLGTMAHAFYLVELLALHGLPFTFKGGTCLSLIVGQLDRLSIDVDIEVSAEVSDYQIEEALNNITSANGVFQTWERQARPGDVADSSHYKLFYQREGARSNNNPEHILLDVVRTTLEYPGVAGRDIDHPVLVIEGDPVRVVTPTIESLLGDKLTACAPLTVGVPIDSNTVRGVNQVNNKHPEMIKQLFDINVLIPLVQDWDIVGHSFIRTLAVQQEVFQQAYTTEQVVRDLARRALALFSQLPTEYHPDLLPAHEKGHRSLRNYIALPSHFVFEQVKMASLRAAYAAHCILVGEIPLLEQPAMANSVLEPVIVRQIIKGLSKPNRQEAVAVIGVMLAAGYAEDSRP